MPLLSTLFQYGQFTVTDVLMSRDALVAYSVGLLGLIMVKVLAPGFYARQNIKTPVKIALITLAATQLMNLAFIGPYQHAGLALAIGLGACVNAGLLFYKLRRHAIYQPQPGWLGFMLKVVLAVSVMGGVLWFGAGHEADWLHSGFRARLLHLLWLIPAGAGAYFATLFVLGFRPAHFARREA